MVQERAVVALSCLVRGTSQKIEFEGTKKSTVSEGEIKGQGEVDPELEL